MNLTGRAHTEEAVLGVELRCTGTGTTRVTDRKIYTQVGEVGGLSTLLESLTQKALCEGKLPGTVAHSKVQENKFHINRNSIVSRANHTQSYNKSNHKQSDMYGDNERKPERCVHNPSKNYSLLFPKGLKMMQDMRVINQNSKTRKDVTEFREELEIKAKKRQFRNVF